jgi:hypothetical protein
MRAFADGGGTLHLLYRDAGPTSRDMVLLTSSDRGKTFVQREVSRWYTQTCPMSSSTMAGAGGELMVATEAAGRIEWSRLREAERQLKRVAAVTSLPAKHPAMAVNKSRDVLLAWAEGAGWGKGGELKWRMYDAYEKPRGDVRREGDLPTWSFAAVVHLPGRGFVIIY